eukprot:g1345.t1
MGVLNPQKILKLILKVEIRTQIFLDDGCSDTEDYLRRRSDHQGLNPNASEDDGVELNHQLRRCLSLSQENLPTSSSSSSCEAQQQIQPTRLRLRSRSRSRSPTTRSPQSRERMRSDSLGNFPQFLSMEMSPTSGSSINHHHLQNDGNSEKNQQVIIKFSSEQKEQDMRHVTNTRHAMRHPMGQETKEELEERDGFTYLLSPKEQQQRRNSHQKSQMELPFTVYPTSTNETTILDDVEEEEQKTNAYSTSITPSERRNTSSLYGGSTLFTTLSSFLPTSISGCPAPGEEVVRSHNDNDVSSLDSGDHTLTTPIKSPHKSNNKSGKQHSTTAEDVIMLNSSGAHDIRERRSVTPPSTSASTTIAAVPKTKTPKTKKTTKKKSSTKKSSSTKKGLSRRSNKKTNSDGTSPGTTTTSSSKGNKGASSSSSSVLCGSKIDLTKNARAHSEAMAAVRIASDKLYNEQDMPEGDSPEAQRIRRRIRNCISAKLHRERRRVYVESLETQILELREENKMLRIRLDEQRQPSHPQKTNTKRMSNTKMMMTDTMHNHQGRMRPEVVNNKQDDDNCELDSDTTLNSASSCTSSASTSDNSDQGEMEGDDHVIMTTTSAKKRKRELAKDNSGMRSRRRYSHRSLKSSLKRVGIGAVLGAAAMLGAMHVADPGMPTS